MPQGFNQRMDIILLELLLVLGVFIGLGVWQLYDVNKALKEENEKIGPKNKLTDRDEQSEILNQQDER